MYLIQTNFARVQPCIVIEMSCKENLKDKRSDCSGRRSPEETWKVQYPILVAVTVVSGWSMGSGYFQGWGSTGQKVMDGGEERDFDRR